MELETITTPSKERKNNFNVYYTRQTEFYVDLT